MSTAIIYIRLSPKNGDDKHQGTFYGAEAQLSECRRWAASQNPPVEVLGVYSDIDTSGALPISERPELSKALTAMSEQGANFLLVGKRDRLARETLTALLIERDLKRIGARVMAANGNNEDTPEAKLLRGILDVVAEFEREIGRARTKAALQAKKARGEFLGRPPRGYTVEDRKLVKLPPEPGASGYDWTAVSNARRESRRAAVARAGRKASASAREALARNQWAASIVPGAS